MVNAVDKPGDTVLWTNKKPQACPWSGFPYRDVSVLCWFRPCSSCSYRLNAAGAMFYLCNILLNNFITLTLTPFFVGCFLVISVIIILIVSLHLYDNVLFKIVNNGDYTVQNV